MNHIGTEMISSRSYVSELLSDVPRSIDLTLILNRHGDAADAEDTVSYIEPDSVVFIEGFSADKQAGVMYKRALDDLAQLRLNHGKQHPDYVDLKSRILEDIDFVIMCPQTGYGDYTQHKVNEIRLLLTKDCIVQYADFVQLQTDSTVFNEMGDRFRETYKTAFGDSPLDDESPQNIAKIIRRAQMQQEANYALHAQREYFAVALVKHFYAEMAFVEKSQPDQRELDLNITNAGKIKTYVTYGAAHSESLGNRFEAQNFSLKKIMILQVPEYHLIAGSPSEFVKNTPRVIAFLALESVSMNFLGDRPLSIEEKSRIYGNLASFNDTPDETLKFLIRCIQINQEGTRDHERALGWAMSLREEVSAPPAHD